MKRIPLILIIAVTLIFTGFALTEEAISAEELVVAQEDSPVSLDPHAANDGPSIKVWTQMHDNLIQLNEDMEIVPGLAHDWEQIDELTWEF